MKFIKENKGLIITVVIACLITSLFEEIGKLGEIIETILIIGVLIYLLIMFYIVSIHIKKDTMSYSSPNKLLNILNDRKKQLSKKGIVLIGILLFLCFTLLTEIYELFIPQKYSDMIFIINFILIFIVIIAIVIIFSKSDNIFDININIKEKDKLVKEYEQHILSETKKFIKKNNKKENIEVIGEIEYKEQDKVITKRKGLSKDYESNLVLKIYQNGDYIETVTNPLIRINNVLKKSLFETKLTEAQLELFLSETLMVYFSDEYQYYNSLKDLLKNIHYNKLDNIKYFMLIPEEINDSPYYKEYFNIIEKEHTELKEFLDELGIDYKKPLKVSCNQLESRVEVYIEKRIKKEYIDLIEYNSVYRGTIEIPNNLLETKTKTGIQIGMTYSEEDECTLIFINFQKEMKRLK